MSPLDHLPQAIGTAFSIATRGAAIALVCLAPVWLIVWSLALPPRTIGLAALLPPAWLAIGWAGVRGQELRATTACALASAAIVGLAAWVSR